MTRKTLTTLTLLVMAALVWHQADILAESGAAGARDAVAAASRAEAQATAAAEAARQASQPEAGQVSP